MSTEKKKRGRPAGRRYKTVTVGIEKDMLEDIKAVASARGMRLSAYLRFLVKLGFTGDWRDNHGTH